MTFSEWPAYSPDMNPIEGLWAHLKAELHRRYPDTKLLRGTSAAIQQKLQHRLWEIWWDIGEPRRVKALIAARGRYTKY
jgi:hypothetical protein